MAFCIFVAVAFSAIIFTLTGTVLSQHQGGVYFKSRPDCGTIQDRALVGNSLENINSTSKMRCTRECMRNEKCRSVNFSGAKKRCELHSDIATSCSQLVSTDGYAYYERTVSM